MGQIIEVLEILVERRRASHFKENKDMTNQSVFMWSNVTISLMKKSMSLLLHTSADVTLDPAVDSDGRPNTDVEDEGVETVSQKKVKEIDFPAEENEHLSGYRIMDMDILLALIKSVACPKCFVVGSLTLVQNAKYGLAFKFCVCCNNCKDWKNEFITSTKKV